MRTVDQNYWFEYYQVYNAKRYADLVNNFFTENPTFQNPKFIGKSRKEIIDFFTQNHLNVSEELIPRTFALIPEVSAIEIDGTFMCETDLPDFYVMPLKKNRPEPWAMAAFYHMKGDRITHARIFWMGNVIIGPQKK